MTVNTNKSVDEKIFTRTATKTKKINIEPKTMRGGTRLWEKLKNSKAESQFSKKNTKLS